MIRAALPIHPSKMSSNVAVKVEVKEEISDEGPSNGSYTELPSTPSPYRPQSAGPADGGLTQMSDGDLMGQINSLQGQDPDYPENQEDKSAGTTEAE